MIRPQPKPVREIDEAYVAWIKALPCLVRNRSNCIGPVDPHHVVPVSKGGSDRTCVPLCRGHHDIANRRRFFEQHYGVDLKSQIALLNFRYDRWYRPESPIHQKRERKKRMKAVLHVTNCEACGHAHEVPWRKITMPWTTDKAPMFRCINTNQVIEVRGHLGLTSTPHHFR